MFARTLSMIAVAAMVAAPAVEARGGFQQTMPTNGFQRGGGGAPVAPQAGPRGGGAPSPGLRQNAPAVNSGRSQAPQQGLGPVQRPQVMSPAIQGRPQAAVAPQRAAVAQPGQNRSARPAVTPGVQRAAAPAALPGGGTGNTYNTTINTTINRTTNIQNNYNGGGYVNNWGGYSAWSVNAGWGGWGWGWRGGCPGCWYAGVSFGGSFIGGYVVGTMLAQPVPAYVYPVTTTGVVQSAAVAPTMEPAQAYSSSPAYTDTKTGQTCANRTVQRPKPDGGQYLYTSKFCVVGGVWQEYQSAP